MKKITEWLLRFAGEQQGEVVREIYTDQEELDSRVAGLVTAGKCCVITPLRAEHNVPVSNDLGNGSLIIGPAVGQRFPRIVPRKEVE